MTEEQHGSGRRAARQQRDEAKRQALAQRRRNLELWMRRAASRATPYLAFIASALKVLVQLHALGLINFPWMS